MATGAGEILEHALLLLLLLRFLRSREGKGEGAARLLLLLHGLPGSAQDSPHPAAASPAAAATEPRGAEERVSGVHFGLEWLPLLAHATLLRRNLISDDKLNFKIFFLCTLRLKSEQPLP